MDINSIKEYWEFAAGAFVSLGGGWTYLTRRRRNLLEQLRQIQKENQDIKIENQSLRLTASLLFGLDMDNVSAVELKKVHGRQNSSKAALRALMAAIPELAWVKRRNGEGDYVYIMLSQIFARLYLNNPPQDFEGKRDTDIWSEAEAKAFTDNSDKCYNTRIPTTNSVTVHSPHSNARGTYNYNECMFYIDDVPHMFGYGDHEADNAGGYHGAN